MKTARHTRASDCCPPKARLAQRPLLSPDQAAQLADVFATLANDTRLRMLHALVQAGELSVGGLAETLGMKPQAVSNQLQRMSDRGILDSRREGTSIIYRIVDPCVATLLDRGWCLSEDATERTGKRP